MEREKWLWKSLIESTIKDTEEIICICAIIQVLVIILEIDMPCMSYTYKRFLYEAILGISIIYNVIFLFRYFRIVIKNRNIELTVLAVYAISNLLMGWFIEVLF